MSAMLHSAHLRKLRVQELSRADWADQVNPDRTTIGLELDGEAQKRTTPALVRDPSRELIEVSSSEAIRVAVWHFPLVARSRTNPGEQLEVRSPIGLRDRAGNTGERDGRPNRI